MIYELEDLITYEMMTEQQDYEDNSFDEYVSILALIVSMINDNRSISKIKKEISTANINKDLESNLNKRANEQYQDITDEKTKLNFNEITLFGYTFKELIAQRKQTTQKSLINFMVQVSDLAKEEPKAITALKNVTLEKYKNSIDNFYQTQLKDVREVAYKKNDSKMMTEVKGWISIAILDNATSAICASLHNQFYEKGDLYQTRSDLPYQIPRHPHCRSMFITVFKSKSIRYYKEQTVEKFLNKNPNKAKAIMGIEKFRLFQEKKIKFVNFVDLKKKRFYTNAEIRKRLNIK
jgi:hypothetical protein